MNRFSRAPGAWAEAEVAEKIAMLEASTSLLNSRGGIGEVLGSGVVASTIRGGRFRSPCGGN